MSLITLMSFHINDKIVFLLKMNKGLTGLERHEGNS